MTKCQCAIGILQVANFGTCLLSTAGQMRKVAGDMAPHPSWAAVELWLLVVVSDGFRCTETSHTGSRKKSKEKIGCEQFGVRF